MKITEINASTQEVIERDMTAEELTQAEADKLLAEATKQANQEEKAKAEAKRLVALAKLEALGLDENDLKALGLQARTIFIDNDETMCSGYSITGANR